MPALAPYEHLEVEEIAAGVIDPKGEHHERHHSLRSGPR
jgi:hypothetical protein